MNIQLSSSSETARDRFERIHAALRMRICLLDYTPGRRLSEQALAEEFGISRTPLRRVLVRLESEGLLQSVHGVGTFVTDPGIADLVSIYELRLELAELLGVLGPAQPDAALWQRLRTISARIGDLVAHPGARRFGELNLEFFLAFHQITTNEPLRTISERLFFQTARIWLKTMAAGQIDVGVEAGIFGNEVNEVLRALEIGDLRSAALIHRSHISMSFQRMLRVT
jgi:DNA-binding GntR family transcriptional regulator